MQAQDKVIADRTAASKKAAGRKPATTKPKAAPASNHTNVGKTCSTRGCDHPAKRRGLCSGKGSANHYRKQLRAERTA